jgi:high-affinity nickel-transport protein
LFDTTSAPLLNSEDIDTVEKHINQFNISILKCKFQIWAQPFNVKLEPLNKGNMKARLYPLLIFYAIEASLTIILVAWLIQLSNVAGSVKYYGQATTLFTLGVLAYTLGLRHALDADHVVALNVAAKKLTQEGKDARFIGLFFALGHASVVIAMTAVLIVAYREATNVVPQLQRLGGVIGNVISSALLFFLGLLSLLLLRETYKAYRAFGRGEISENELEAHLAGDHAVKGFRRLFEALSNQRDLFVIGFLFGISFDLAGEVVLLAMLATSSAPESFSPWELMIFPMLYTVGTALMDTSEGFLMTTAHEWALSSPERKAWFNVTMSVASTAIAWLVAAFMGLNAARLAFDLQGGLWSWVAALTFGPAWESLGTVVLGVFAVTWVISTAVMKARERRVDDRLGRSPRP